MQITINVDCTPEEARRFLGLPDLEPLHQAYIEKMQKAMDEMGTSEGLMTMVRNWGPMSEQMLASWGGIMGGMGKNNP